MIEAKDSDSTIIKIFRNHGFKATPQRLAIARYMMHNKSHPTVNEIYLEIREMYPSISLTTVYKTIKFLKDANFLQELDIVRRQVRFDPNIEPHVHLVCTECGVIIDYNDPSISKNIKKIFEDIGFIVKMTSYNVAGICKACQKNSQESSDSDEDRFKTDTVTTDQKRFPTQ